MCGFHVKFSSKITPKNTVSFTRPMAQRLISRLMSSVCLLCLVYNFVCDLCDADYVSYTARHLFQRVAEHKNSAIGKHFHEAHGRRDRLNESHFKVLRKCQGKFDCLLF